MVTDLADLSSLYIVGNLLIKLVRLCLANQLKLSTRLLKYFMRIDEEMMAKIGRSPMVLVIDPAEIMTAVKKLGFEMHELEFDSDSYFVF